MYTENDLVRIAKRENNNKRKYLVVNQLQGKHVPVLPSKALDMFQQLGRLVKTSYTDETLLIIGFAETATAIGAAVAVQAGGFYMQTTREIIDHVEYLFFSEAHSHATEQKLVKDDIDMVIDQIDRIVFIEDEVTTGNTIMNIIRLIDAEFPNQIKFSVASLLNGMNAEAREQYEKYGIQTLSLIKTCHDRYEAEAEAVKGDGNYLVMDSNTCGYSYNQFVYGEYLNARRAVSGKDYLKACESLWLQIHNDIDFTGFNKILVLGTEEFMFPALYVAGRVEESGKNVRFHATTRSPIVVSNEEIYPLHIRYELASVYDKDRITFVYDLDRYDLVLIITDSDCKDKSGVYSIINALQMSGNSNINFIRWCQK